MNFKKLMEPGVYPMMEADGGASGDTGDAGNKDIGAEGGGGKEEETLTPEQQFEKLLNDNPKYRKIHDTRMNKSMETREQAVRDAIEAELKEKQRVSKLSADEQQAEELKKARADADRERKEKEDILRKHDTLSILSEKKLSPTFVDYLLADTNEKTLERINNFETEFNKAVEAAVKEKIPGYKPGGGTEQNGSSADEELRKKMRAAAGLKN